MTQSIPQCVGIDISKDHLDVHVYPKGMTHQVPNNPAGISALFAWLRAWPVERIAYEATGPYHRPLEQAARDKPGDWPLVKVNPRHARHFAEASGTLAKTDPADAAMLARFAAVLEPPLRPIKTKALDDLSQLVAARRALIKDRTALRNRAKTLTLPILKRQNQQRLKQIDTQINAVDQACRDISNADPALAQRRDILNAIAGIGEITAIALIADVPELGTLNPKQIASLAGRAPVTRQSGNWKGKSVIKGGRANVRHALYMPDLVAIQHNPDLKAKYNQLIKQGKPKKIAITAVMRKLIVLANTLLKQNRKWKPNLA